MTWINARLEGSEVQRTDEPYIVGEHEAGYVFPRGLALEESPSTVVVQKASDLSELTEVTGVPGAGEYRVLYDPEQPLGGAFEFNVAEAGIDVLLTYWDRGSLVWAHDSERWETTISDTAPLNPKPGHRWWDSEDGTEYIYYDDGTTSQWVEV